MENLSFSLITPFSHRNPDKVLVLNDNCKKLHSKLQFFAYPCPDDNHHNTNKPHNYLKVKNILKAGLDGIIFAFFKKLWRGGSIF